MVPQVSAAPAPQIQAQPASIQPPKLEQHAKRRTGSDKTPRRADHAAMYFGS